MGRISTQSSDPSVSNNDTLIVVDSTSKANRKASIEMLGQGLKRNSLADPSGSTLLWEYQTSMRGFADTYFHIPGVNDNEVSLDNSITSFIVSNTTFPRFGSQRTLINRFDGLTIKITDPINSSNFAFYEVTGVEDYINPDTNIVNTAFAVVSVTFSESSTGAKLNVNQQYGMTAVVGSSDQGLTESVADGRYIRLNGSNVDDIDLSDAEAETFRTELRIGVTPHTATFGGRINNISRVITGSDIIVNDIEILHHSGFTYTINSAKFPTGWTVAVDTAANPDNINLTIPSSATAGVYSIDVNYTSTETATSTTHTDVLSFNVTLTDAPPAPVPYYTRSGTTAVSGDQILTSSPWVTINENVTTGTSVVFTRPEGHTGTYYGEVAIRTSGTGAVTIDFEASFDEGTAIPDVLTVGTTPTGYTIYEFPLHLPRTTITISIF